MINQIVLDTDVASLSFKRRLPPTLLRAMVNCVPAITFATQGELTKWSVCRDWGPTRSARWQLDQELPSPPQHP